MKKFPWRSILYLLVLIYLLVDLRFCNGPLKRKIAANRPSSEITRENARKFGWVAIVNREPITSEQLELAVARHLYQRGEWERDLNEKALQQIKRATLNGLIDDLLIAQYADGDAFSAPGEEIARFIAAWESQFPTEEDMQKRSRIQDLSEQQRHEALGRIWSRKRWLEQRIGPAIGVTDDELRNWYDTAVSEGKLKEPEKIEARHIFVSTVEDSGPAPEEKIRQAHQRILDGEDFAEVAREISEDQRTRMRGGRLNWFSRNRLPEDFRDVVFSQPVGELGQPFKTDIGWFLVEVTGRQKERDSSFDEVKQEIRIYLENQQRKNTVEILLKKLRKVASITLFTENMD